MEGEAHVRRNDLLVPRPAREVLLPKQQPPHLAARPIAPDHVVRLPPLPPPALALPLHLHPRAPTLLPLLPLLPHPDHPRAPDDLDVRPPRQVLHQQRPQLVQRQTRLPIGPRIQIDHAQQLGALPARLLVRARVPQPLPRHPARVEAARADVLQDAGAGEHGHGGGAVVGGARAGVEAFRGVEERDVDGVCCRWVARQEEGEEEAGGAGAGDDDVADGHGWGIPGSFGSLSLSILFCFASYLPGLACKAASRWRGKERRLRAECGVFTGC